MNSDEKLKMVREYVTNTSYGEIKEKNSGYWIIWGYNKETNGESIEALCISEHIAMKEVARLKIDKPGIMLCKVKRSLSCYKDK